MDNFTFTIVYLFSTLFIVDLIFSLAILFLSLANLFFSLANMLLTGFLVILADNLFVTIFLSIGWPPLKGSYNSHVLLHSMAFISLSITSHHFSSCSFSATLRSFSACNCSSNFETSFSSSKHRFCKAYFLLSKLVCKIALPLTSFLTLCCKSLFAISNLYIKSSSSSNSEPFDLFRCSIKLFKYFICSINLIELFRRPTKLIELASWSTILFGVSTCSTTLSRLCTCLTSLCNLLSCLADLSTLLDYLVNWSTILSLLVEFSMLLVLLVKFSTCLCSTLELRTIINNISSSTSSTRLVISSLPFPN